MIIDLKEFRDQFNFTQAEVASELGITTSRYAMMERGARKIPRSMHPILEAFQRKYSAAFMEASVKKFTESADVVALRNKARQLSVEDVQSHVGICTIQIIELQKKLVVLKRQFNKALHIVNQADNQLSGLSGKPGQEEMKIVMQFKRNKAMKTMQEIVKQNPAKMLVKIEALKQEQIVFENAGKAGSGRWLEFDEKEKEFLSPAK